MKMMLDVSQSRFVPLRTSIDSSMEMERTRICTRIDGKATQRSSRKERRGVEKEEERERPYMHA